MPESRTEISERHALEWSNYRGNILAPAMQTEDANEVKIAKTIADAIRITQDGERRAWTFAEGCSTDSAMEIAWDDSQQA